LKIIFTILLFFIILAVVLAHGLKIPHIDLPGLEISEFYIKLDKKLIIEIDRIEIGGTGETQNSLQEMEQIGSLLRYLPHFFESIQINDIVTPTETVHLLFYDDVFYVETDKLQLATRIYYDEKQKVLFAKIATLYFVEPDLSVKGKVAYDGRNGVWKGEGKFDGLNVTGNFLVWQSDDTVRFIVNTDMTDSIKPLVDYLAPPEPIKVWIYPKIPAKRYILHYLKGEFTIRKDGSIGFDPMKMEGSATAYDARIHFHPRVPPVRTKRIDVTYRHDTLGFRLHDPVYEGKKLRGSHVRIRNLLGKGGKTELDAHIVVRDRFDESIRKILDAYEIPVPFVQTEGVMDAAVDLTVALVDGHIVSYRGDYRSQSAVLLFDKVIPVPVENLHVVSKDTDVTIDTCRIRLKPYLDAQLKGTIDLAAKHGDFRPTVTRLLYEKPKGTELLRMERKPLRVTMDFKKEILFQIADPEMRLVYRPGGAFRVEIPALKGLKPYLRGPLAPVDGGHLHIDIRGEQIDTRGEVVYRNKILSRSGRPVETFETDIHITPAKTVAKLNDNITLVRRENLTTVEYVKLDVHLMELRRVRKPYLEKIETKEGTGEASQLIRIHAADSTLYTNFSHIPCDSYHVKITTERPFSVLFESKHGDGEIRAIIYNDNLKIVGQRLPDRVIHGIPALKELHGGYFDFDAAGRIDDFNGTIILRDTLWAKSPVYNNILAALNSVPAILTLKNPGFSNRGFKIRKGVVKYRYKAPVFHFEEIAIKGSSADIFGKGAIDFEHDTIDVRMRIKFLETISRAMHKVPVAGYILFGDDGTISIGLSVEGPLKNPKVKTTAAKDIITAPINIIRRTFTFPFHLFE